jgi:hypothetical protein
MESRRSCQELSEVQNSDAYLMAVTVRVLHIFLIFCSRSISGSLVLLLHLGESPMAPRRSWAKADNPFWSNHVAAWYRSALEAEQYCRKHDLSTASLMRWARHLLSAQDLRKRAEDLQKSHRKKPERQPKNAHPNRPKRPRRNRYSVRTDSGPLALQAFWGMHVEAMNFSGMGHAEYAAALGLCVAHLARSAGTIRQRNGLAIPAPSECPGSIKQRC